MPSVVMFDVYIKFLTNVISAKGKNGSLGYESAPKNKEDYISHLMRVFGKADTMGCLNEDLACQYVMLYKNMGNFDEAMKLAENFCEGKFSDSRKVWVLRVTERIKNISEFGSSNKAVLSSVFDLLKGMVKKVAISDAEGVWVMVCYCFIYLSSNN